jgi:hypothetical protein
MACLNIYTGKKQKKTCSNINKISDNPTEIRTVYLPNMGPKHYSSCGVYLEPVMPLQGFNSLGIIPKNAIIDMTFCTSYNRS